MARTTKQLSGAGKDKLLAGLVAGEAGITQDAADRLRARLTQAITEVRVRREVWDELREAPTHIVASLVAARASPHDEGEVARKAGGGRSAAGKIASTPPPDAASSIAAKSEKRAASASPLEGEEKRAPAQPPADAHPAPFDPFAFSAVAVLAKQGRAGLMAKLAGIAAAEHLRAFADAQHLAVDSAIVEPEALRAAILTGAERRIAERRAAAS